MYNLIHSALYKTRKSKTVRVLFFISLLSTIIVYGGGYAIANGNMNAANGNILFLFSDMSMLTILGAVLASHLIGSEFEERTIQHLISSGYGRFQIVAASFINFWIASIFIMLPYIIATFIALITETSISLGNQTIGFLNLLTAPGEVSIGKTTALIATMTIIYIGQITLAGYIAILLKKAMFVIAIFYGLSFLSGQVASVKDSIPALYNAFAKTPFGGEYIALHPFASTDTIVSAIIVSISFIGIVLFSSFMYFRKADIK